MAVLEMLAEVVRTIEFLAQVTLAEFVYVLEVADAILPILIIDEAPPPREFRSDLGNSSPQ